MRRPLPPVDISDGKSYNLGRVAKRKEGEMYYYLATKDENGRWSLWVEDGRPTAMTPEEAQENLTSAVNVYGPHNVMLLQRARFSVEITVEIEK
jgi:hypothetical protein